MCKNCKNRREIQGKPDFQYNEVLQTLIKTNQVPKNFIFKKVLTIGFVNEKFENNFFNLVYFPQFEFFEKLAISKLYVNKDGQSLLRDNILKLELKYEYNFTQILLSLTDKLLACENQFFTFIEP